MLPFLLASCISCCEVVSKAAISGQLKGSLVLCVRFTSSISPSKSQDTSFGFHSLLKPVSMFLLIKFNQKMTQLKTNLRKETCFLSFFDSSQGNANVHGKFKQSVNF